ncbi:MAG: hypothetical protein IJL93_08895 [Bacteroidales bacterium]|nr:hypothetical protein [Bacteroidales bacterium]
MPTFDLSGLWDCAIPGQSGTLRLPGTLDESGIGFPDDPLRQWQLDVVRRIGFWHEGDPIVTRLTRKHTFEGQARISRTVEWPIPADKRVFLECERARHLRLLVNGREAPLAQPACLSAPDVFEITGLATGRDEFIFLSDNSYPGWPRDAIVYSSAASDETQTNWNGLLGFLRLRTEDADFVSGVRVYPHGNSVDVHIDMDLSRDWEGAVHISSPALNSKASFRVRAKAGISELCFRDLALNPDAERWDLEAGVLHPLTVASDGMQAKTVTFGIRHFLAKDGRLTLNGRRIFLRGEANCAVFPETGYCPMTVEAWRSILKAYRAYGVNCVRFHSHCPPEAAFIAADEMGMLMQPELSHWNPKHAFSTEEARAYYAMEARQIICHLANHPSFVMLTLGNELHFDEADRPFVSSLLESLRAADSTRLYANGSNAFYGTLGPDPASDFFTASDDRGRPLRATSAGPQGWLNQAEPSAVRDYSVEMALFRRDSAQPVFSFEVGQYEILPDFSEISSYQGIARPDNLLHMQRKMRSASLEAKWKRMVEATGESALQCYRTEVEAALRTGDFSGISLLGLQDFPGQGTALVGMMDAHLQPKPYSFGSPERFSAFFRDVLPLALLPKFVFTVGESLRVPVRLANYGKTDLTGHLFWTLTGCGFSQSGSGDIIIAPSGGLTGIGCVKAELSGLPEATRLTLTLSFCGHQNTYPLWVYPDVHPVCPENVYECRVLDEKALSVLTAGGRVYLAPDSTADALPHSVPAHFSPDFWSVCTFPQQSGTMGQLIDASHPLFRHFPTETFSTWQWHAIASQRALLLPHPMPAIIAEMDSCAFLCPMAKLFECRCHGGRLLVSSLGLHHLAHRPEARALQQAIYDYMSSDEFRPAQELPLETAKEFLPFE